MQIVIYDTEQMQPISVSELGDWARDVLRPTERGDASSGIDVAVPYRSGLTQANPEIVYRLTLQPIWKTDAEGRRYQAGGGFP